MELVAIHTFTKHHWCCPALKPWLEQDPSMTWYGWSQKRRNAVNESIAPVNLLFALFPLTGCSFPKEAESIDHHTWFLANNLLHKLLKGFRCSTNPFATCVVSRTLPPKIPFFQCLGDFLAKRYHFLSCRVCWKYLPQFCRPHFYIISLYTCYSCICEMTLTRKWQERVNGWLIYCRGFELLPVFLGFVWQIAFNLSLVSTCQPHFSGNVVWWACRLGLSRGGQTVCRLSPFQSWSELIHPPGLKWRGFHPLRFVCQFFNIAEMPGLQPALATLRSVKDSGLSELLGPMTAMKSWWMATADVPIS